MSFKEMRRGTAQAGQGLSKIHSCCKLAAKRGFAWVWIDTCCIDKKSSAELTNQSIRCSDGMRTPQSATYIFPMSCGMAEPRGILESSSSGAYALLRARVFRNFWRYLSLPSCSIHPRSDYNLWQARGGTRHH